MLRVVGGRRNRREQRLDERLEVGGELVGREPGPAFARVRVHDRELDLRLVGVEVEEELVDLVHDLRRARVRPVDLVHDEDDREPRLERLAEHEPRLRQRALARVDEEQHAVDHRQAALDLAAEVGVPGRVDDVHLRVADLDGRVLGEDRDALLALEVDRVHARGRRPPGSRGTSRTARAGRRRASSCRGRRARRSRRSADRLAWRRAAGARARPARVPPVRCSQCPATSRNR